MVGSQGNLFADAVDPATGCKFDSPAAIWAEDSDKHALDELFRAVRTYRTSKEYWELMKFVRKFRFYSPYNAFLLHIQRPGVNFVAPAYRWKKKYGYKVKPNANPLVILQPMGPVMFVFDVSDVEPGENAEELPREVKSPFEGLNGKVGKQLEKTIDNAKRDGVKIFERESGSQSAGAIKKVGDDNSETQAFQVGKMGDGSPFYEYINVRYHLLCSDGLSKEGKYSTIVHELAHLYCGHLGTPNKKWWPDREGLSKEIVEFEAESVAYLVCQRLNIDVPSAAYLSSYVKKQNEVPRISLECVMKAAGLIEKMGRGRLKKRKK